MAKKKRRNKLSKNDVEIYKMLFNSLLFYSNNRLKIFKEEEFVGITQEKCLEKLAVIRDALWADEDCFPKFVEGLENSDERVSPDILNIVKCWVFRVEGVFLVAKHCKDHSLFIDINDTGKIYAVKGLYDPVEKLIPASTLPVYVKAVLLPFEGKIINDGLMDDFPPMSKTEKQEAISAAKEAIKNQPVVTDIVIDALTEHVNSLDEVALNELTSNLAQEFISGLIDKEEPIDLSFDYFNEVANNLQKAKKSRKSKAENGLLTRDK